VPSRFLAKGRGVIGLSLQQPQVATRVTPFHNFCLIASELLPCAPRASPPFPYGLCPRARATEDRSRGPCHVEHEKKTFFSWLPNQPKRSRPSRPTNGSRASGRSEAESLYGRRSGGYTRVSAPGCRFRPLALCFQQVPQVEAAGYSHSNRQQSILPSTIAISKGSRRRNLQQLCSTRAGVTCPHSSAA
jgi:hypothetical protein